MSYKMIVYYNGEKGAEYTAKTLKAIKRFASIVLEQDEDASIEIYKGRELILEA